MEIWHQIYNERSTKHQHQICNSFFCKCRYKIKCIRFIRLVFKFIVQSVQLNQRETAVKDSFINTNMLTLRMPDVSYALNEISRFLLRSLCRFLCWWTIISEGIIDPVVSVSAALFIRYICYIEIYSFLMKDMLKIMLYSIRHTRPYPTIPEFGYPV